MYQTPPYIRDFGDVKGLAIFTSPMHISKGRVVAAGAYLVRRDCSTLSINASSSLGFKAGQAMRAGARGPAPVLNNFVDGRPQALIVESKQRQAINTLCWINFGRSALSPVHLHIPLFRLFTSLWLHHPCVLCKPQREEGYIHHQTRLGGG